MLDGGLARLLSTIGAYEASFLKVEFSPPRIPLPKLFNT
jgi:hypothetical protein